MTVWQSNNSLSMTKNVYRLVGIDGNPHPVLDTPYESIDAAVNAARSWSSVDGQDYSNDNNGTIGIEVSTSNGSWRTIGYS